jgi:uncharacterized YigZ family protein
MITVTEHTASTLVVRQSKFIAHLMPFSQFDEILAQLKSEHPKARHFVTAYRYLNEYDQITEGSSDDGEPKGTSGRPTLAVLQGQELINTAIITVRYFGGTKLGTGGLVRAYSDAANLVIDARPVTYTKVQRSDFLCAYSDVGKAEYLLGQCGAEISEKMFEPLHVRMFISATEQSLACFYEKAGRLVIR